MKIINDQLPTSQPYEPVLRLTNAYQGDISAHFHFHEKYWPTDDSGSRPGWHHFTVPIGPPDEAGNLPASPAGYWVVSPPGTSNWTTLLSNVTEIGFRVDISSEQSEFIGYDNISLTDHQCCLGPPKDMVAWWSMDEPAGTSTKDLVLGNDGSHRGTLPIVRSLEFVTGSLMFNGLDNALVVADPPDGALDFGPASGSGSSDFSIDAWIRPISIRPYQSVVSKLGFGSGGGLSASCHGAHGYAFGLNGDRLSLQLSTGLCQFAVEYVSDPIPNLADGQWHSVAVVVDRDMGPGGIRFYHQGTRVDDGSIGPVVSNINSTVPLVIGAGGDEPSLSGPFHGGIDEVEMFGRALEAGEIGAIAAAGRRGKCKLWWTVPRAKGLLQGNQVVVVPIEIYNIGVMPRTYTLYARGLEQGFAAFGQVSNVNGASTYVLNPTGPVVVAPRSVRSVDVTINRPTEVNGHADRAAYAVRIAEQETGSSAECVGFIVDEQDVGFTVEDGDGHVSRSAGTEYFGAFQVINNTPIGRSVTLRWCVLDAAGERDTSVVGLGGASPGNDLIRVVSIGPGGSLSEGVAYELKKHDATTTFHIVLNADLNGDGFDEPVATMGLRSEAAMPVPVPVSAPGISHRGLLCACAACAWFGMAALRKRRSHCGGWGPG